MSDAAIKAYANEQGRLLAAVGVVAIAEKRCGRASGHVVMHCFAAHPPPPRICACLRVRCCLRVQTTCDGGLGSALAAERRRGRRRRRRAQRPPHRDGEQLQGWMSVTWSRVHVRSRAPAQVYAYTSSARDVALVALFARIKVRVFGHVMYICASCCGYGGLVAARESEV